MAHKQAISQAVMTELRKLPHLAALRAFEAAARLQSFSAAALELHLTHGAISHQVRALEQELAQALFTRHGKRLTITVEGERFAHVVRQALHDVAAAADALRASARHQVLSLSAVPSFASRWLAPRLGRFMEQHPGIEVRLQSSGQLQALGREGIDIGIRYGAGLYPGLEVVRLMGDTYYPVASPQHVGGRLPGRPEELARHLLLRSLEPWQPWFDAAGLALTEPGGGVQFEDLSMLITSAVRGDGIALVRHAMVLQELESGSLQRLFDVTVKSGQAYYMACPPQALKKPQVQAFRAWLLAEVAAFRSQVGAWVA